MNEQQLAQYRQLATAGENNVAMCSEYQQAITALLAMVERLTGDMAKLGDVILGINNRLATAQAERDAALAELAAERDAARRHAAYIASCVDECGSYIP